MSQKWYQNWFNSPYYHILYYKRNQQEAEFFIDNLLTLLKPTANSALLDIACGRGRHSLYLNQKGFDVTGIDLSVSSIKYAKQFENNDLHFFMHDMRYLFYINYFDIAFNLFTSFGYFETKKEHVNALKTFRKSLKPTGMLVLDYFNAHKIVNHLVPTDEKFIDGIDFKITKHKERNKIIKTIDFSAHNHIYHFQEEVQAFSLIDFEELFKLSGFEIVNYFGDYALNDFEPETSERLIFVCKKAI